MSLCSPFFVSTAKSYSRNETIAHVFQYERCLKTLFVHRPIWIATSWLVDWIIAWTCRGVGVPIKVSGVSRISSTSSGIIAHQNLCVVHSLTLLFEGEVLCEMPALMVAPEQEECGRVVDLQRPQEQHTLQRENKWDGEYAKRWTEFC